MREAAWTRAGHAVASFGAGAAILIVEFGAVRMLAPHFGQSTVIWSVVIGLVLTALAVGYWLGGRLGERASSSRPLIAAWMLAALWIAAAGWGGAAVCRALTPRGLPVAGGLPLGFTGSAVATLVLFAVPALLLAMTTPYLVRRDALRGREGQATGRLYAAGTLGSLVGCWLAPLVWLQTLGTSATLLACAAGVAALAALGLLSTRVEMLPRASATEHGPGTPLPLGVGGLALAAGLGVTVIEFAALRLMSPWFGQSNPIWANVIGVLLLALALGAWAGGRVSDRVLARGPQGAGWLCGMLGVAALWMALAVWVAPRLLEWLLPRGVGSMDLLPVAFRGSLVASVLLFGPPLLLLGAVPPFLVRLTAQGHPGRRAGAVLALGTVGGLLGCVLTAPWLVPGLGSRGALLLGALLATMGAALARLPAGRAGRALLAAGGLACGIGLLVQCVERPALRVHPGQVFELESPYQTVRVVRQRVGLQVPLRDSVQIPALMGEGAEAETLFLRHDEDSETYQSLLLEDPGESEHWLTGGRYFEHLSLGALFAGLECQGGTLRVLLVGYAGGTVHRTIRQILPPELKLELLGVEIDPGVIEVARRHLAHRELEGPGLRLVTGEDARTVVNALPEHERFDLVLVDAYARTNYLPFQLASVEFFEAVRRHLRPGGWVGVNVLGNGWKSPVARSVAATMGRALGHTYATPNPAYPGNVILWASPNGTQGPRLRGDLSLHPALLAAGHCLERLLIRHVPERDGGVILTDDRSPSDRLADEELGL